LFVFNEENWSRLLKHFFPDLLYISRKQLSYTQLFLSLSIDIYIDLPLYFFSSDFLNAGPVPPFTESWILPRRVALPVFRLSLDQPLVREQLL
jgi:hypothetical protein